MFKNFVFCIGTLFFIQIEHASASEREGLQDAPQITQVTISESEFPPDSLQGQSPSSQEQLFKKSITYDCIMSFALIVSGAAGELVNNYYDGPWWLYLAAAIPIFMGASALINIPEVIEKKETELASYAYIY